MVDASVDFNLSGIGYSENLYNDWIFMGLDRKFNVEWASVFDYAQKYDNWGDFLLEGSLIYIGFYAGSISPTIISLDSSTGEITQIKMFTYFEMYINDIWGKGINNIHIDFSLIESTEKYLFR